MKKILAYFDGCCEPVNPGGTAAYGAVIFIDGKKVWTDSQIYLPTQARDTSNNVAEYNGFLAILIYLYKNKLHEEDITIMGDSKLVIEQMFGTWGINQGFYVPFALRAKKALVHFPNLKGKWIPREQNGLADKLSKARLKEKGVKFRIQPE